MKKLLIYVLAISLLLCCTMSACSCKEEEEEGILPSGKYDLWYAEDGSIYYKYCRQKCRIDHFFSIEGNKAYGYTSGSCDYRANVVEENGKIYFYGYKWRDILQFGRYVGNEYVCEVTYDEENEALYVLYLN